jgi:hypothetical protein
VRASRFFVPARNTSDTTVSHGFHIALTTESEIRFSFACVMKNIAFGAAFVPAVIAKPLNLFEFAE